MGPEHTGHLLNDIPIFRVGEELIIIKLSSSTQYRVHI
jgi:hypothetical protein